MLPFQLNGQLGQSRHLLGRGAHGVMTEGLHSAQGYAVVWLVSFDHHPIQGFYVAMVGSHSRDGARGIYYVGDLEDLVLLVHGAT